MKTIVIFEKDLIAIDKIKSTIKEIYCNEQIEILQYSHINSLIHDIDKFDNDLDVLFFEINLIPQTKGICFLKSLHVIYPQCQIIFMAKKEKYTSEIYEADHVAFMTKPLKQEHIKKILMKIKYYQEINSFKFHTHSGDYSIAYEQILAFEKEMRKINILTASGREYSFYGTFNEFIEELGCEFIQCHRSIIINIKKVEKMENNQLYLKYGNGYIVIPVSRPFVKIITNKLRELYVT